MLLLHPPKQPDTLSKHGVPLEIIGSDGLLGDKLRCEGAIMLSFALPRSHWARSLYARRRP
jgi:hypothetical protein